MFQFLLLVVLGLSLVLLTLSLLLVLEKIKHLEDKLKSKPDDENEDDELARVAALTEENWRNWRRKEVEIENSEELNEEDYEEVEDYQQLSEERREDGKEEASWGDEEESKELVEIQTQLEENW